VLIVTDAGAALTQELVRWCREVAGAQHCTVLHPRRSSDGEWGVRPATGAHFDATAAASTADANSMPMADVCIFKIEREFESTVAALKAAVRLSGGYATAPQSEDGAVVISGDPQSEGDAPPVAPLLLPPLLRPGAWVVGPAVKLGRGLHSFTFQLNVSAFRGRGGACRGCFKVVLGGVRGIWGGCRVYFV
jgi:hypothetical protein